jgi:hypothetical protein
VCVCSINRYMIRNIDRDVTAGQLQVTRLFMTQRALLPLSSADRTGICSQLTDIWHMYFVRQSFLLPWLYASAEEVWE